VTAVVLDKTGTITTGKPVVSDEIWIGSGKEDIGYLLQAAATAERGSEHPVGQAILRHAKGKGTDPQEVSSSHQQKNELGRRG